MAPKAKAETATAATPADRAAKAAELMTETFVAVDAALPASAPRTRRPITLSHEAKLAMLVKHLSEKPMAAATVHQKILARESFCLKGTYLSGNLLREGLWRASAGGAAPAPDDMLPETLTAIGHADAAPQPKKSKRQSGRPATLKRPVAQLVTSVRPNNATRRLREKTADPTRSKPGRAVSKAAPKTAKPGRPLSKTGAKAAALAKAEAELKKAPAARAKAERALKKARKGVNVD